jgi:hypothetical protein
MLGFMVIKMTAVLQFINAHPSPPGLKTQILIKSAAYRPHAASLVLSARAVSAASRLLKNRIL